MPQDPLVYSGTPLPESLVEHLDELAEEHGTPRSAVIRAAIDNGLRAAKYYPDELALQPERHVRKTAADMAEDGDMPPEWRKRD